MKVGLKSWLHIDRRGKNYYNNSCVTAKLAGVAELADALDLGSSVYDVKVQVLSPAPNDQYSAGVAQW